MHNDANTFYETLTIHNFIKHYYTIYLLSSHFESYFKVRLKLNSFLPEVTLYISERKITASALVNSAFVPAYYRKKGERDSL